MYHRLEARPRAIALDHNPGARGRLLRVQQILRHLPLGILLLLALGCDRPPRPQVEQVAPQRPPVTVREIPSQAIPSGLPASGKLKFAVEAPFDLWDAYFLNGEQIGYSHIHAEPTSDANEIRYRVTERMQLRRGDAILNQHLQQTSFETLGGDLLRFEATLDVNGELTKTRGEVRGKELVIHTERAGQAPDKQVIEKRIPWDPSIGGLLALQQSLKEDPLAADEQRRIRVLAPMFYEIGALDIRGLGTASVPLLSGEPRQLQEAESVSSIEGNPLLKMHLWIDDEGNVLKSFAPSLGLSIFRTDEETAKQFETPKVDLMIQSRIELERAVERPRELHETVFSVQTKDPEMTARFLKDTPGQRVRKADGGGWEVAVTKGIDREFVGLPPGEEDRTAGPLIQSNDRRVQELAAIPEETEESKEAALAEQLARVVYSKISNKNLESGFASAAEVASSGQGDCTEHAVLLAAMCRARGIPARVAAGLLYVDTPDGPAMAFHMWTLAHVDGGWLALDGTMENGVAAADRITLVSDNLAGGTEYAMVAPVMQSLGQLEIQIETTR